jgi:hypothetical protein
MVQTRTDYLHASMLILSTAESLYTMAVSALIRMQTNTLLLKHISTLLMCITS